MRAKEGRDMVHLDGMHGTWREFEELVVKTDEFWVLGAQRG